MLTHALVACSVFAFAGTLISIAAQPHAHTHEGHTRQPAAAPAGPVNSVCPIRGEAVDVEAPTRSWKGHTIGFCCPGCDTAWDAKPAAEKDAFLSRFVKTAGAGPAIELGRALQGAIAAGDIGAIDRLFLSDGRATVLENGTDEGTWERYRDGHLKPELAELVGYEWRAAAESGQAIGDAVIVKQAGTFSIGDEGRRRTFAAAITLVVVDEAGSPRVAHMHWSTRELPPKGE